MGKITLFNLPGGYIHTGYYRKRSRFRKFHLEKGKNRQLLVKPDDTLRGNMK